MKKEQLLGMKNTLSLIVGIKRRKDITSVTHKTTGLGIIVERI